MSENVEFVRTQCFEVLILIRLCPHLLLLLDKERELSKPMEVKLKKKRTGNSTISFGVAKIVCESSPEGH